MEEKQVDHTCCCDNKREDEVKSKESGKGGVVY